jgi:hypothetical protein
VQKYCFNRIFFNYFSRTRIVQIKPQILTQVLKVLKISFSINSKWNHLFIAYSALSYSVAEALYCSFLYVCVGEFVCANEMKVDKNFLFHDET